MKMISILFQAATLLGKLNKTLSAFWATIYNSKGRIWVAKIAQKMELLLGVLEILLRELLIIGLVLSLVMVAINGRKS